MSLLLVTGAVASEKTSLTLPHAVSVAGKQLNSGDYTLQWEGNGPNIQLNFLNGKTVVASTPARLVDLNRSSPSNAVSTIRNGDGTSSLSEIRMRGKKYSLEIGGEAATAETASSTK